MFTKDFESRQWNYIKLDTDEPIGILYGHFAPFTGPNGHGRLIKALQNLGVSKFIVANPDTGEKLDEDRSMYNTLQRKVIIEKALEFMNITGRVVLVKTNRGVEKVFNYLAETASKTYGPAIRPVFVFGPDRESDFGKYFVKYNENLEDPRYEYIIDYERGTSGTKVRELIKEGDVDAVVSETGYTPDFVKDLIDIWHKNQRILQRQGGATKAMAGKHSLKHMFNDNKTSQMSTAEFLEIMNYIEQTGGSINKNNFDIAEKIDGSSSFIGYDDFGFYFSKFGAASKMRRVEDVGWAYKEYFKLLQSTDVADVLADYRTIEGVDDLKVQLENVIPSASKDKESVQTVLVKYNKDLIGNGLVITIQAIADGIEAKHSSEILAAVQDSLKQAGLNCRGEVELDVPEIDLSEEIADLKNADKQTIRDIQMIVQDKILTYFSKGSFGDDFEGLVLTSKDKKFQFKITSARFKELMKIHNRKTESRMRLQEGGNLIVDGSNGSQQATKILTQEMGKESFERLRTDLKDFLVLFAEAYREYSGVNLWSSTDLIDKGEIFSGSTRTFFTKDYESYSRYKPAVGDMDVQVPMSAEDSLWDFLRDNQGKSFGMFTLYGTKDKHSTSQDHSLITYDDESFWPYGCQYIQIDWEYSDFEDDKPTEWTKYSHYSSWEDIENNVKGAFIKILLKAAIRVLTERNNFVGKRGKPVKGPASRNEFEFNVDKGLVRRFLQIDNDVFSGEVLNTDSRPSQKDWSAVYRVLFNEEPEKSDLRDIVSFVRFCKKISQAWTQEQLQAVYKRFLWEIWTDVSAQQLDRNLESDTAVKTLAVQKMLELVPALNTPENQKYWQTARDNYIHASQRGEGNRYKNRWQTNRRLNEDVSPDGETLYVYSSSKDTDLFKYYIGDQLKLGLNGGSAYGIATYALADSPFSGIADIGYSDKKRADLYGENCFKFSIDTSKVLFFIYEDFMQTKLAKETNATPDDFIAIQIAHFNLPEEIVEHEAELTPENGSDFTSAQAQLFFRLMSRHYYQDARGALRTPVYGFVYKGRNDGHTYVGWNSKALIPESFSTDLGQTWQPCDKTTPEYQEYLRNNSRTYQKRDDVVTSRIFDGNKTPEKVGVYRLFMKANSTDDGSNLLPTGVFQDIVIHDDKTIDCTFKSNLPYVDNNEHLYLLRKFDPFLSALNDLDYKWGVFNGGLKFGSENKDTNLSTADIPESYWPDRVTGSFKVAGIHLNKTTFQPRTEFANKKLQLVRCCIEEDVFDDWEVLPYIPKGDPKVDNEKLCYTPNEYVWNELAAKYDWMQYVAKEKPETKTTKSRLEGAREKADKLTKDLETLRTEIENTTDLKVKARLEKKLEKAIKAVEDQNIKVQDYVNAAETKNAEERAKQDLISRNWKDHVDRVKQGWIGEDRYKDFLNQLNN